MGFMMFYGAVTSLRAFTSLTQLYILRLKLAQQKAAEATAHITACAFTGLRVYGLKRELLCFFLGESNFFSWVMFSCSPEGADTADTLPLEDPILRAKTLWNWGRLRRRMRLPMHRCYKGGNLQSTLLRQMAHQNQSQCQCRRLSRIRVRVPRRARNLQRLFLLRLMRVNMERGMGLKTYLLPKLRLMIMTMTRNQCPWWLVRTRGTLKLLLNLEANLVENLEVPQCWKGLQPGRPRNPKPRNPKPRKQPSLLRTRGRPRNRRRTRMTTMRMGSPLRITLCLKMVRRVHLQHLLNPRTWPIVSLKLMVMMVKALWFSKDCPRKRRLRNLASSEPDQKIFHRSHASPRGRWETQQEDSRSQTAGARRGGHQAREERQGQGEWGQD